MNREDKTIDYYNSNTRAFMESTKNVAFESMQQKFLKQIPEHGRILDFGCGSGRDAKYFQEHGYQVDASDGSEELCKAASAYTGIAVKHMYFEELAADRLYDGIWACASILHVHKEDLPEILSKMCKALKNDGTMYVSFKYGTFQGERNGRYFTDLDEKGLKEVIKNIPDLVLKETWVTSDARPGRENEKWLNAFLKRKKN